MRRLVTGLAVLCALAAVLGSDPRVPVAQAATPYTDIASAGPLTDVFVGNDLSCQVQHAGVTNYEMSLPTVAPGDCGTFIIVGGTLYAPNFHARGTATGNLGSYTAFTPVSQSAVAGAGTAASPYRVITIADAGDSGVRITEADSYVVGQESYQTDIRITNTTDAALSVKIYRGGDCYLGGDDEGYGLAVPAAATVACTVSPGNSPAGLIEQWSPITPADHYYEAFYRDLWSRIGAQLDLPDSCRCGDSVDNAAAIQWNRTIPVAASVTLSHLTTFSTDGSLPVVVTKSAGLATVPAGGVESYTITLTNPNASPVSATSIVDELPAGFAYIAGTSGDVTSSDPAMSAQQLTWSGPFAIDGDGGTLSLRFDVVVSAQPGTYYNNASTRGGADSVPTGDTAPVVVSAAQATATATVRLKTHTPTATATVRTSTPTATAPQATATPAAIDTVLARAATPRSGVSGAVHAPNTGSGAGGATPGGRALIADALLLVAGAALVTLARRVRTRRAP